MPIQWFIGPTNRISGRTELKTTAVLGKVLKSKWFCQTSLQHDSTNVCVVTMKVAVNCSLYIGMDL